MDHCHCNWNNFQAILSFKTIGNPLERSLKDKKIGISYLGVTLEGTKDTSIGSQVVQEGIKFLKKGKRATAGSSKKKTVRQRISAMR